MEKSATSEQLISMIVPVYNSAPHLGYCLNSILNQTYQNLEIILIDDGSIDNSLQICQNYAALDARVQVIATPHYGVSSARNTGLDAAHGDYIVFIDSDDVARPDLVTHLVQLIGTYNADFAVCGYQIIALDATDRVERNITVTSQELGEECVLARENFFAHLASILVRTSYLQGPVCKIFKRDLIEQYHLRFLWSISLGEDFCFNMDYFQYMSGPAVISSRCCYYYLQALPDALSRRYRPDRFENELFLLQRFQQLLLSNSTPSPAEEAALAEYSLSKIMQSLYHLTDPRCDLSVSAKKAAIANILNHSFVRQAYDRTESIPTVYAWIHECMEFCDAQKAYEFLFENRPLHADNPFAPVRISVYPRPGLLNRVLVSVCDALLNIHHFRAIARFRRSLSSSGVKTTSRKVISKTVSKVSAKLLS